jgi:hypothetical protein
LLYAIGLVVRVGLLRGAEFRGAAHMLPALLGNRPFFLCQKTPQTLAFE